MNKHSEIEKVNLRLSEWIDELPYKASEIIERTNIPTTTFYAIQKPGHSIKHEYLMTFVKEYDLDLYWLFDIPKSESVDTDTSEYENTSNFKKGQAQLTSADENSKKYATVDQKSTTDLEPQKVIAFEKHIAELAHRIENGPWSTERKIELIDLVLSMVESDIQNRNRRHSSVDDQK